MTKSFFRVIKYFDLWFPKNVFAKLNVNIFKSGKIGRPRTLRPRFKG